MKLHAIMLAAVRRQADHGALVPMFRRVRGFRKKRTASATIKGFDIVGMIRRGHGSLKDPGGKWRHPLPQFPAQFHRLSEPMQ